MGWSAGLSVGCEETAAVGARQGSPAEVEDLTGHTVRDAFDRLIQRYPAYCWRLERTILVVRPRRNPDVPSPLDIAVSPGAISGAEGLATLHDVLAGLFGTSLLRDPVRTTVEHRPVAVQFSGGSLVDLLNAMVDAYGSQLSWHVGYSWPHEPTKRLPHHFYVGFELLAGGGIGWIVPRQAARPADRVFRE
jgi:hypothetical protein